MAISDEKITLIRNLAAFWIFGLCNNYAFVIMLSAAEDIMDEQQHKEKNDTEEYCLNDITESHCSSVSTGAVLLADILPSLMIEMTFPFFIQWVPFGIRHGVICVLQVISYLIVAYSTSVSMSLIGVIFASVGSGLGEITYLALSSHFPRSMVTAWSSGTGGAGIIGSLAYAGLTEPHLANLSPKNACLAMLIVPILFAVAYWFLMISPETVYETEFLNPRTWIIVDSDIVTPATSSTGKVYPHNVSAIDWSTENTTPERLRSISSGDKFVKQKRLSFKEQLLLIVSMSKYMFPLAIVYIAEYLINQGLTELIYFDCSHGFHLSRSSQYRWYQVLYQLGVFFSRSSAGVFKIPFWIMLLLPVLQMANAVFFTFGAIYFFIPHIWIVFILILYEGLLGGSAYANTFYRIHQEVAPDIKEYCLSAAAMSDAIGIVIAAFIAIPLHNFVCDQQKYHVY